MKYVFSGLLAAVCLSAAPTAATVYTATSATLHSVFASASSGDTIKLSGNFGQTTLANRSFASMVTIDASRARFSDTLVVRNIDYLTIQGGVFGNTTGSTSYLRAIAAFGGSNLLFNRIAFVGNDTGTGLGASGTTHVKVASSTFTHLKVGAALTSVSSSFLLNNSVTYAASDGFEIADSRNVTASGNKCSLSTPSPGAHPDCIQMWSIAGNPIQSDIIISGNTATGATQGFTSFDPANASGLRFKFLDNIVNTSYPQGVACYGCIDSVFTGNKLTTLTGALYQTAIHIVGGSGNVISGNTVGAGGGHPANHSFYSADPLDFSGDAPGDGSDTGIGADPETVVDAGPDDGSAAPDTSGDSTDGLDVLPLFEARFARDARVTGGSFDSLIDDPVPDAILADVVARGGGAVPEPASWVMLISGFALAGSALRQQRRLTAH